MGNTDAPFSRPVRLWTLVRGLIAMFAVIAIVTAFTEKHIGLAIASILFLVVAVPLGYWAWRFRQSVAEDSSPPRHS